MTSPAYGESPLPGVGICGGPDGCGALVSMDLLVRHTRWHSSLALRVQLLRPDPDDVILILVPRGHGWDRRQAAEVKDDIQGRFPGNEVLLLAGIDIILGHPAPEPADAIS